MGKPPSRAPVAWNNGWVVRGAREASSQKRRVYCALIGHPFSGTFKKDTYIFVAYDPVLATVQHNRRAVVSKDTRAVAPFWRLNVVCGPFTSLQSALACSTEWVNGTRGKESKRARCVELARRYGVTCYSDAVLPPAGLRLFFKQRAPPAYAAAFDAIRSTSTTPLRRR